MSTSIEIPDNIEDFCIACVPVGSRVTCNPPPTDTDQDILCLVEPELAQALREWLDQKGWELEGEYGNLSDFDSYRGDVDGTEYNLILTESPDWFDKFMDATFECKKLNVMEKANRIAVFEKHMGKKKVYPNLEAQFQAVAQAAQLVQAQASNPQHHPMWNQINWAQGHHNNSNSLFDEIFGNTNVTY